MMRTLALPASAPRLRPPRVRSPGLAWLPAVLRQRATWRTVRRFVLFGPLVAGAPYLVFIITIPLVYLFGVLPAALAGLLFGAWYHGGQGRAPSWPWRAVVGALCGAAPVAVVALEQVATTGHAHWTGPLIVVAHGVPAAVILALSQEATPAAAGMDAVPAVRASERRPTQG
jgi:hypothetical protein